MDETDRTLLKILAGNARMPVASLAKKLGLARSTVQARLDRLETTGMIAGYTLRLGEAARARAIRATVLLQIEPRALPGVLARLNAMPEVETAHSAAGRFDLVLTLAAPGTEALDRALDEIGRAPGVTDSESLVHLTTRIDRGT